jgi:hypothetical protein
VFLSLFFFDAFFAFSSCITCYTFMYWLWYGCGRWYMHRRSHISILHWELTVIHSWVHLYLIVWIGHLLHRSHSVVGCCIVALVWSRVVGLLHWGSILFLFQVIITLCDMKSLVYTFKVP